MCDGPDLFLCILAVLFPPIAVWVKRGLCGADSLINIALCLLGYLPGLLHAWYIISKYPDPGYEALDNDEADVRVYYVRSGGAPPPPSAGPTAGAHTAPGGSYGTIGGQQQPQGNKKNNNNSHSSQQQSRSGGNGSAAEEAQPVPGVSYAAVAESHNEGASRKIREQALPEVGEGAGPSDGQAPPSYSEVVRGDNKIQSHE